MSTLTKTVQNIIWSFEKKIILYSFQITTYETTTTTHFFSV